MRSAGGVSSSARSAPVTAASGSGRPAPDFSWAKISGSSCRRSLPICVRGSGWRVIAKSAMRAYDGSWGDSRSTSTEMPVQLLRRPRAQRFRIGHEQGDQAVLMLEHRDLPDLLGSAVDGFDLVGKNVLAA